MDWDILTRLRLAQILTDFSTKLITDVETYFESKEFFYDETILLLCQLSRNIRSDSWGYTQEWWVMRRRESWEVRSSFICRGEVRSDAFLPEATIATEAKQTTPLIHDCAKAKSRINNFAVVIDE